MKDTSLFAIRKGMISSGRYSSQDGHNEGYGVEQHSEGHHKQIQKTRAALPLINLGPIGRC